MLDEGAKAWLTLIETKKKEVDQWSEQLKDESRRNSRLKSAKTRDVSNALIEGLGTAKAEGLAFIETETSMFFKEVFGVELYQPVAVKKRNGAFSKALYATQLIARQLSNGFGVFTVTGDSANVDLHKGLPACDCLMAQEADDDWFVVLA